MKRGIRLTVLIATAALALTAIPAAAASNQQPETYLALGDSYAFGFNPLVVAAGGGANPANFPGYSDALAHALDLSLFNAACPGETSGSFISGTLPDNGCHEFYPVPLPRHVLYTGSQLAYAVNFLKTHDDVSLVTLQIGGNDFLQLQAFCMAQRDPAGCLTTNLPGVEAQLTANLRAIYSAIRNTAHYKHTIAEVSYFAFNYHDPANLFLVNALDGVEASVAEKYHARVVDVFGAFQAASAPSGIPCLAGLQVALPTGGCDIHPSAAGHAVYTQAILEVVPRGEAVEARS